MMEYRLANGKTDECWILRTSILRNLVHRPDTQIDHHGIIEWIDHRCLVDMRGKDWSCLQKIKTWISWTAFVLFIFAGLVWAGYLQSLV